MTTNDIRNNLKTIEDGRKCWAAIKKDAHYDKTGFGFNLDDRFTSCKITLSLDSWSGVYGCSSCSTFMGSLGDPFKTALMLWMNANRDAILDGVETLLRDELRKRKVDELAALDAKRAEVEAW